MSLTIFSRYNRQESHTVVSYRRRALQVVSIQMRTTGTILLRLRSG
jgi:hypothetical protein